MKNRRLLVNIIDISIHLAVGLAGCALIFFKSGSALYALLFFAGGVLIDLDHLVDHFICFGVKFRPIDFFSSASILSGKAYVPLHSWELVAIVTIVGLLAGSPGLIALSAGAVCHLTADSVMRKKPMVYFLLYRIKHGFNISAWSGQDESPK